MKVVNVSLRHMFSEKHQGTANSLMRVGSVMQTLSINVMIASQIFSLSSINLHSFHLLATTICRKWPSCKCITLWITQEGKSGFRAPSVRQGVRESQRKEKIVKNNVCWNCIFLSPSMVSILLTSFFRDRKTYRNNIYTVLRGEYYPAVGILGAVRFDFLSRITSSTCDVAV
ncbi:hypothetical protein BvCmsNSP007_05484 [Escherichia coli]|nr:hypothetical protein BvCmsNSP007_05484 [Escherichia coli]GDS34649.1 hypothetical protein BvCmsOUP009_01889 [Escherichia coli]